MSGVTDAGAFIDEWAAAICANDVSRMGAFVTDDWILIDRPGITGRDGFHRAVRSGMLSHDTMAHEVVEFRQLSHDVVLLVTRARSTGSFQGEPISADEWTTDVLVRADDGWRCAITQLTPRSPAD